MSFAIDILKKHWIITEKADQRRIAKQKPTQEIKQIIDIPYVNDGNVEHLLDIYTPACSEGKLPVLIDVHGGGWMYGNKELNKNYCLYMASLGFAVVNINYRLAPNAHIDGQLQDIFAVLNWLDENGEKYPLDMKNIYITGDSAGAHLAGLAMMTIYRDDMSELFSVKKPSLRFNAVGFSSGAFDLAVILRNPLFIAKGYAEIILGPDYKKSPFLNYVSLIKLVGGVSLPPIYMVSSKEDFVGSQSVAFSKILNKYDVSHQFHRWGKVKGKALMHVFNIMYPEWKESIVTNKEMASFFLSNKR